MNFSNNLVIISEKTKTNTPNKIVWTTSIEPRIKTTMKKGNAPRIDMDADLMIKYSLYV